MSRIGNSTPGSWYDQGQPLGPTPEEHQLHHEARRQTAPSNPWAPVALGVLIAASPFIAGLAIYLHFFA